MRKPLITLHAALDSLTDMASPVPCGECLLTIPVTLRAGPTPDLGALSVAPPRLLPLFPLHLHVDRNEHSAFPRVAPDGICVFLTSFRVCLALLESLVTQCLVSTT